MTGSRSRSRQLRAQAQRGERRGQPRRLRRERQHELRRRRADRRSEHPRAAAAAAAQSACEPDVGAGRAAAARRRRNRQQPGRQQQRLLPGQSDRLGGLVGARRRRRRHDVAWCASSPDCAADFPNCAPRRWVEGRRADGSFGVLWLTPHATEMTGAGLEFPGRTLPVLRARRRSSKRTRRSISCSTPRRSRSSSCFLRLPNTAAGRRACKPRGEPRLGGELPSGSKAHARAAVHSGVFGLPMTASARFGAERRAEAEPPSASGLRPPNASR